LAPEGVREFIRGARYRDLMDPISIPGGYVLGKNQRITDVLAVEDELLRSEGIDPAWVPFTEAERAEAELAEAESLSCASKL
jgi:hypothetical protein